MGEIPVAAVVKKDENKVGLLEGGAGREKRSERGKDKEDVFQQGHGRVDLILIKRLEEVEGNVDDGMTS